MTTAPNGAADTADFEFAALHEARNYRASLLRDFHEQFRGHVLEVGAGIGQITEALLRQPAITRLTAVEPDASFCAKLRARLPKLDLIEGTVANLPSGQTWDAILSVNVLEHIEQDVEELTAYHALLQPSGGSLCLFVPARQEIYAPIDRDFGHFRRYSRSELLSKLRTAGFQSIHIRYYNFVGYFLWWLSFCVLKQRTFNPGSVRLFDRIAFPIIHMIESLGFHPPVGQSLIAIARTMRDQEV